MNPEEISNIGNALDNILLNYSQSFSGKVFLEEAPTEDDLMLIFGLTQLIKAENKQYWGRQLGMCWQRLITSLCEQTRQDFGNALTEGADQICDLVVGKDAIDTKYRIGSGDSGTLKKLRQYSQKLIELGYNPVLLILRTDNLPAALSSCRKGGWQVLTGEETYKYIQNMTGFDLASWLRSRKALYSPRQSF